MNILRIPPRFILSTLGLACGVAPAAEYSPNFTSDLNASYSLVDHLKPGAHGATFVNFSSQYPPEFDADNLVEGENLKKMGTGAALDIRVARVKSHTSKALNLRTENATKAFAEFEFPESHPVVHMTDIVLFLEAFNFYDSTKFENGDEILLAFHFKDPFTNAISQLERRLNIKDYVRNFRVSSLGSKPVVALTAVPSEAYPLRGEDDQPFMDLQTLRFTEAELKLRLVKLVISVPSFKTMVPLPGTPPATVFGGIRIHGIAITTDFNFTNYTTQKPFDLAGPWYSQADALWAAPWRLQVVNEEDPFAWDFINKGCWISAWASVMHAQGATKVQELNSTALVNLTPLTLARYAQKLNLFKPCPKNPGSTVCLPFESLPHLLRGTNTLEGNTVLAYEGQQTEVNRIEDHLARKIPVLLKVSGDDHFVVANGMETSFLQNENKWVKTYILNDVGYRHNVALVKTEQSAKDYGNKFEYALFMAPSDKNRVNSIAINIFSPVRVFIVDPLGRRLGVNPADGTAYDEIPGVTATLGAHFNTTHPDFALPPDPDPVKITYINDPAEGEFNLQFEGTGSGPYTVEITRIDAFGNDTTTTLHGNTQEGQIDPLTIAYASNADDAVAPVTIADFMEKPWNNVNPLVIAFTATDAGSGVAQTFARVDGSDALELSSITLDQEGGHTVEFWSVDRAGNVETARSLFVRNDFSAPVSSHDYAGTGTETGAVTLHFESADALSGPAAFSLTVNGTPAANPLTLTSAGPYMIEYFSTDVAGNVETPKSLQITIDPVQTVDMNLKAKVKQGPIVDLKWKHAGSGNYRIMRSLFGADDGFVEIGTTTERKFDDGNVAIGSVYYYRIHVDNLRSEAASVELKVE